MSDYYKYKSVLAPYMNAMLEEKSAAGIRIIMPRSVLKEIDDFALSVGLTTPKITKEFVRAWRASRLNDSANTICYKVVMWRQLARLMLRHGCEAYIPRLPRADRNGFTPHIFSQDEMARIFSAVDGMRVKSTAATTALFAMPAILRLLYGTGVRVSECLNLLNKNVHIEENYIHVEKSKNGSARFVPISDSLCKVLKEYMSYRDKIPISGLKDGESRVFIKPDGTNMSEDVVYDNFRHILDECKIPYIGNHRGPRVHDIRHTYAVHALAQMARSGMDLYAAMPLLSTALGHKKLSSTEKYVRLTCEMFPELEEQASPISAFVYPKVKMPYEDKN